MKFQDKEISDLSDIELTVAIKHMSIVEDRRTARINSDAGKRKFEKIQVPTISQSFLNLKQSLLSEQEKRKNNVA